MASSGRSRRTAWTSASASVDRRDDLEAVVAQQPGETVAEEREILGDHDAHGSSALTVVGPAGGALDRERPVERLDPPPQPGEPAPGRVGAARAVVGDRDLEPVVAPSDRDLDARGAGVLGGVRERLGGDEVRGRLDAPRAGVRKVDRDGRRQRAAVGERLERGADAPVGEHRRVDAAGEVAQLRGAPRRRPARASATSCLRGFRVGRELLLGHAEAEPERDQPGLRTVVQVALDPAELGVLLLDRAEPRHLERLDPLRAAPRVRFRARRA